MIRPKSNVERLERLKDFGSERLGCVRLDKNERTVPFSDHIHREMLSSITAESVTAYPDQRSLYAKLSRFLSVPQDQLLLAPGSDAAIKMVYETYVAPGDSIAFLDPTYAMIEVYADLFEARKIKAGYDSELRLRFDDLLASIKPGLRVLFVANPNQPTGTILTEEQIEAVLTRAHKAGVLVVFDEAYLQFSGQPSLVCRCAEFSNLIVLGTFSKGFGIASARLGYIVSHAQNINSLYKVKTLADINLFALKLGEYLVDHYDAVESYVEDVRQGKYLLERELSRLGIELIKGYSNFVHIKLSAGIDLKTLSRRLQDDGFLVRVGGSGLPAVLEDCVRITVGPPKQMLDFLQAFKAAIAQVSVTVMGGK